jgi:hypothetical protein
MTPRDSKVSAIIGKLIFMDKYKFVDKALIADIVEETIKADREAQ